MRNLRRGDGMENREKDPVVKQPETNRYLAVAEVFVDRFCDLKEAGLPNSHIVSELTTMYKYGGH